MQLVNAVYKPGAPSLLNHATMKYLLTILSFDLKLFYWMTESSTNPFIDCLTARRGSMKIHTNPGKFKGYSGYCTDSLNHKTIK